MPKVVLLPVSSSSADPEVFAAALAVAQAFDSHLVAIHVRPDVRRDIAALSASGGGMAAGIDTMLEQMETNADDREKTAREEWQAFCSTNNIAITDTPKEGGITSEWVYETGTEADWLAEYGRTADLIIVGRGKESWGPDYVLMEAAVMDTGKPVLVAPPRMPDAAPLKHDIVGIAWTDTREAGGAVSAALPFLRSATRIIVFSVAQEDDDREKSRLRLARMLRWHNANISVETLDAGEKTPASVLLEAAAKAKCGLLVMGGYGHGRLREAVFGGFTREVLESAPLPVLMSH